MNIQLLYVVTFLFVAKFLILEFSQLAFLYVEESLNKYSLFFNFYLEFSYCYFKYFFLSFCENSVCIFNKISARNRLKQM